VDGKKSLALRPTTIYLGRETALILGFSYFILAGGTLNGVMRFRLRSISQGLLALVFFAWLIARLRRGERVTRSSLDGAVLVFLAFQLFAALLSTDPRRSLAFCGQWMAYALCFYLLRDLLRHGWPGELIVKSLLIVSGILLGLGLTGIGAQWLKWASTGNYALPLPLLQQRFYSMLGDPNMTAGLLNLLLPLALVRLTTTRGWGSRILLGLWIAAALLTQALARSQGGVAGLSAAVLSTSLLLVLIARPRWLIKRWVWAREKKWPLWLLGLLAGVLVVGLLAGLAAAGNLSRARGPLWSAAWQTFLRSPLWGSGPFTFGTQLMLHESIPPHPIYPHAHNYLFNTLAETGLLGLLASIWMAGALGLALLRAWQRAAERQRRLIAGAVGSLLGFAAHSLADNHIILPSFGAIVIALLALALNGDVEASQPGRVYRFSIGWLGLPALIMLGGSLWSGRAYWHFEQGRQLAQAGMWSEAAPKIERAAQIDPAFAFYHLQSGYVRSVLAAENPNEDHLERAIEAYERGVALEPNF